VPCGLTAIRGSHPGSFQAAQALRYRRLPSCPTTPASAAASSSWRGHQRSRRCAFPSRASRTGQPHSPARQSRPLRRSSTQHLPFHDQLGLKSPAFFDRETFGADQLILGIDKTTIAQALGQAPFSRRAIKSSRSRPAQSKTRSCTRLAHATIGSNITASARERV
jgi:hypothetical protein